MRRQLEHDLGGQDGGEDCQEGDDADVGADGAEREGERRRPDAQPQVDVAARVGRDEVHERDGAHEERHADADDPRDLVRQARVLGGLDRQLDPGPERGQADQERQVGVEVRLAGRDRPPHDRRVDVVEVEPPERAGDREAERRRGRRLEPPAHGRRPDHDGQDALAEDDDREQPDPLRDVRGVDGHEADAGSARRAASPGRSRAPAPQSQ